MTRWTRLMMCAWLIFLVSRTCLAQDWTAFVKPMIGRDDFEKILVSMNLTEEQQVSAQAAFALYWSTFGAEVQNAKAQTDQMASADHSSVVEFTLRCQEISLRLQTKIEKDVSALLTDNSQQKTWRHGVVTLRRRAMLNELHAQRMKHTCDLIAMLYSLPLTEQERAATEEPCIAYESQLDDAIQTYLTDRVPISRTIFENQNSYPGAPGGGDPVKYQKQMAAMERWSVITGHIDEVNHLAAPPIANALSPEHREAFLSLINRCEYPQAFEPCPPELALEAIRMTPDIAADKRDALQSIFGEYAPIRDALIKQTIDVVRKWDSGDNALKRELRELNERRNSGALNVDEYRVLYDAAFAKHPANPLLRRRHDLAMETVHRMRSVFNDDEIQRMPLAVQMCLTTW